MKKLLLSLLAAGMFALPSLAQASMNPYVSISGGLGLANNSSEDGFADEVTYKTGYLINGAVGLKGDMYRVEAEIGYHRNAIDTWNGYTETSTNVSIWSFMANGYLDFDMKDSGFSPYIMGGLGLADANVSWPGSSYSDSAFAWQVGAGVGIKAGDKATVDIGYRYFKPGDVVWDGYTYSLGSSNILVGVRLGI